MSELTTIDRETEEARATFLKAVGELNPIEITWAFNMLKELAEERIQRCEERSMRHAHFGRAEEAKKSLERVPFYRKLIDLHAKWREFEMRHSAPGIVEAVTGRKPRPPRKKV